MRINKYLSSCGIESRRKADALIEAGLVEVNGKKIDSPGIDIKEKDVVKVKGKVVRPEKQEYVIFYKPAGYITTNKDEKGRKTIFDILPEKMQNLKAAGRLDKDSSGLLILTNDGELIQKLTHPKQQVPKVYIVMAQGKVTQNDLEKLAKGIEIEKGKTAYAEGIIVDYENSITTLQITLYQGYNRQIRRMFEAIKRPVVALKRISHANITLAGLKKSRFRYLKPKEVRDLNNYLAKCSLE